MHMYSGPFPGPAENSQKKENSDHHTESKSGETDQDTHTIADEAVDTKTDQEADTEADRRTPETLYQPQKENLNPVDSITEKGDKKPEIKRVRQMSNATFVEIE